MKMANNISQWAKELRISRSSISELLKSFKALEMFQINQDVIALKSFCTGWYRNWWEQQKLS